MPLSFVELVGRDGLLLAGDLLADALERGVRLGAHEPRAEPHVRLGVAAGRLHDEAERAPVDLAGPEPSERGHVLARAVALVLREPVPGVPGVELDQEPVPRHLRDDRGRGDRRGALVAPGDGGPGDVEVGQGVAVHDHVVGADRESGHGIAHRAEGRPQDVHFVDDLLRRAADPDRDGLVHDAREELLPLRGCELLRIVETGKFEIFSGEDDGRGDDRPGQRSSAGLVHARDVTRALLPQRGLVQPERGETRSLSRRPWSPPRRIRSRMSEMPFLGSDESATQSSSPGSG